MKLRIAIKILTSMMRDKRNPNRRTLRRMQKRLTCDMKCAIIKKDL